MAPVSSSAVYLVEACPVPTPADAERLLADLWQLTAGRGLGLFLLGLGGRATLGVTATHPAVAEAAASTIADQCGGAVETGWIVPEMVRAASEIASVNLVPTDRRLAVESSTYGWQRSDPLRGTFLALDNQPVDTLAAVALSLRALPGLGFALSLGAFAAGPAASTQVARLAATFGGIGVRLRRPILQRRAARRMIEGSLRRPATVRRVELVAHFWHPPYASDPALQGSERSADSPAGYLTEGGLP
jgi:hypothetical protein